jgi:hypothetical protein
MSLLFLAFEMLNGLDHGRMSPVKMLQRRIQLVLSRWPLLSLWHGPGRFKATTLPAGSITLPGHAWRFSHTVQQPPVDLNESQYHSVADLALEEILSRLECLEEAVDDVDITLSVRHTA